MAKDLIGLTVESSGLAMYQEQGDDLLLSFEAIPEGVFKAGRIINAEALAKVISEIKERDEFNGKEIALALPEEGVHFMNLELFPMNKNELKMNLPYEFRDITGGNQNEYVFDYAMDEVVYDSEGKPEKMKIFSAATRKESLLEWDEMLKLADLKISTAVPKEMILVTLFRNAIERGLDKNKEFAVINLDADKTGIYVVSNARVRTSVQLELGSFDFEQLAVELRKTLNFYSYENQGSEVTDVYFCGNNSNSKKLCDYIADSLGLTQRPIAEILPEYCENLTNDSCGLFSIGVTL